MKNPNGPLGWIAPLCLMCCLLVCASARAAENAIKNGDFALGADSRGWPKGWQCAGDANVRQTLTLDRDPQRGACARLTCESISGGGAASHVMLLQTGSVALKSGQWYRITFWARQEGIKGGAISLGISETKTWRETGIREGFRASRQWRQFDFRLRAKIDAPASQTRLQIWHGSRGTLWIAGVRVEPSDAPAQTQAPLVETEGRVNLVPNGSFECGTAGWGGITARLPGWGNMNALVGEIDASTAAAGKRSLKIALNEKTTPVFFFDYFDLQRAPVRMPLTASVGWFPVTPGRTYTLSAYLKADRPGVRAVLAVYFGGDPAIQTVTLTREWARYAFTLKAREAYCYVAAGPDLRDATPPEATVWLDGVAFEQAAAPTAFAPADPIEVGVETASGAYVFNEGEEVALIATAFNHGAAPAAAKVTVRLEDFFDAPAGEKTAKLELAPGSGATARLALDLKKKGAYRALVRTEAGGRVRETRLRLAVIAPYTAKDSFFGMNHAYPWDSTVALAGRGGMTWMRDWSLKWQSVEPEKGTFTFAETDAQIDRPLALGEKMDLLLPFPSANWSSSAPAGVKADRNYPANRQRMAYTPRDTGEFAAYVAACVNHYKNRAKTWEILNEPLYTDYSLPRKLGYGPREYAALLKAACGAAKRADPQSFVIGGIAGSGGQINLYEEFIKAGGLDSLDALNIHNYPGLAPPETTEEWVGKIAGLMRAAGKPRPIWLTEIGYYADDVLPRPVRFEMPVLESEKLCAAYYVRLAAVMLAGGVEKIFYHAGSGSPLNSHGLAGIFFDYGDAPRKMFAAQSALANLLAPPAKFLEKLPAPEGLRAYLFETAAGPLLIAWAEEDAEGTLTLADARLTALDIQGNPLDGRTLKLSEYPIYVQAKGMLAEEVKAAVRVKKK